MAEVMSTTVQNAVGRRRPVAIDRQQDVRTSCKKKDVAIRVESFRSAHERTAALKTNVPWAEFSDTYQIATLRGVTSGGLSV